MSRSGSPCLAMTSRNRSLRGTRKYSSVLSARSGSEAKMGTCLRMPTLWVISRCACSPMMRWKFALSSTAKQQSDLHKIVALRRLGSLLISATSPKLDPSASEFIGCINASL